VAAKPDSTVSKIRPSGFSGFGTEEGFKDHHAQHGSSTSLVSSRTHAQLEEEELADEGTEAEGRSSQEGERRACQHHPASDPD
jgi:hypothetical protein